MLERAKFWHSTISQSRAISYPRPNCAHMAPVETNAYETVGNRRVKHCWRPLLGPEIKIDIGRVAERFPVEQNEVVWIKRRVHLEILDKKPRAQFQTARQSRRLWLGDIKNIKVTWIFSADRENFARSWYIYRILDCMENTRMSIISLFFANLFVHVHWTKRDFIKTLGG